jgi:sec-independent protein translocase protein TatB
MFDIGWSEMLVIGSLALIVVGPRDLPKMLRTFGQYVGKARGMAREFQRSMDEAARQADISDMKELRETAQQLRDLKRTPFDSALGAKPSPGAQPAAPPTAPASAAPASAAPVASAATPAAPTPADKA